MIDLDQPAAPPSAAAGRPPSRVALGALALVVAGGVLGYRGQRQRADDVRGGRR